MKKFWWLIGILFLLVACSQTAQVTPQPTQETIFSDADVDRATLDVETQTEQMTPQDLGEVPEGNELPELPDSAGELGAQAVLPNASGFVYYIRYQAGISNPWSVQRANQSTDVVTTIYSGQREIQSIGGSSDGNTIVLSMRQSTTAGSDFEIYRLTVSSQTTEQLTDDTVDNTNVTMTANAVGIAWQQPINKRSAIVFRAGITTRTISLAEPIRQPSLSGNGNWLVFTRKRTNGLDQVIRYKLTDNTYVGVFSAATTTTILDHPSISNTGDKIMWLQSVPGAQFIRLRNLTSNTSQTVVSSTSTLEHPSMTADGNFATYGYSPSILPSIITVYMINFTTAQKTIVRSMPASPSVLQLGMVWQQPIPNFNSEQKIIVNGAESLGRRLAMSGNTAVSTSYVSVYVVERNTRGIWGLTKELTPPMGVKFINSTVAISGDFIAVAANYSVYLFGRNQGGNNNWGFITTVVTLNNTGYEGMAMSGNTIAITTQEAIINDFGGRKPETVYIFEKGTTGWKKVKEFELPNATQFLLTGTSTIALSNDTLVLGIPNDFYDANNDGTLDCYDTDNNQGQIGSECYLGSVYLYGRNQGGSNNWGVVKLLRPTSFSQSFRTFFGYSVAIDGNTVVVGAPEDRIYEATNAGKAYVFSKNQVSGDWELEKTLSACSFCGLGKSVAVSGDTIIVGTLEGYDIDFDGIVNPGIGTAYVFSRNQGGIKNWGMVRKLRNSDPAPDGNRETFSSSVGTNGVDFAVGAEDHFGTGAIYFYKLD
jgi:FG-GAP repeat